MAAPSRLHSNELPLPVNVKRTDAASVTAAGFSPSVVVGSSELIVNVRVSGVASAVPYWFTAYTSNVYVCPLVSGAVVYGEGHDANGSPTSRQRNEPPGWSELKVKVGVGSDSMPDGPDTIVVTGAGPCGTP